MFVHGADFFLFKPGFVMLALGLPIVLALLGGPVTVGDFTFSLHWMLVGTGLTIIGLQSVLLGGVARVLYDYTGSARSRWLGLFRYTRSALIAAASIAVGLALCVPLVWAWLFNDFKLREDISPYDHLALGGITFVVCGFTIFTSTLLLHAVEQHARHG
jgi:hypothetical protein